LICKLRWTLPSYLLKRARVPEAYEHLSDV
jgi:hypothetical protein